jgi:hypothetical protein
VPWYQSSSGQGISLTIAGFSVMGIAQAASTVASLIGHPIEPGTLADAITAVVAALGAVQAAYGLVRKLFYQLVKKAS